MHRKMITQRREDGHFLIPQQERVLMLSDDLVRKTIAILHNLRISDGVISRETVIAIGN